jgi:rhodanese-related sulfurtransferase
VRPVALLSLLSLLLLIAACGAADLSELDKAARIEELYDGYRDSFPEAAELTVEELLRLREIGDPVIVDVRTDEERAISMIPGAISRLEFEAQQSELGDRTVVTYCTIGYRSGLYAEELKQQGWDAYNLEGSILAWTHAGQRLQKEGKETRRLHVYGRKWNLAADDYEAVW